ncbi:hypothetical protein E2C01_078367 [Portunus trituberculatus]|uniref:Uncharacterized protein n=1 Tax=Portunus trituberculatus TaxID=210409 RepID=A0A5B7IIJ6_PORTR|nr:hypothetical protein [Portunus trituberculatus]
MSSPGGDDDCDQIKSSQVFSPTPTTPCTEGSSHQSGSGEWLYISSNADLRSQMCSSSLTNSKIFSTLTLHFQTFLCDVTT